MTIILKHMSKLSCCDGAFIKVREDCAQQLEINLNPIAIAIFCPKLQSQLQLDMLTLLCNCSVFTLSAERTLNSLGNESYALPLLALTKLIFTSTDLQQLSLLYIIKRTLREVRTQCTSRIHAVYCTMYTGCIDPSTLSRSCTPDATQSDPYSTIHEASVTQVRKALSFDWTLKDSKSCGHLVQAAQMPQHCQQRLAGLVWPQNVCALRVLLHEPVVALDSFLALQRHLNITRGIRAIRLAMMGATVEMLCPPQRK